MIEDEADRAVFVSAADFGITLSYTVQGGAAVSLEGLMSNATAAVDAIDGPGTLLTEAGLTVRAADLPGGAGPGDTVVIGAVGYSVRAVIPDGTGLAHIALERV